MIYYLRAELIRVFKRISRLIAMFAILLTLIIIPYIARNYSSIEFLGVLKKALPVLPIPIGVVELLAVFSDDFKAKSMQIAIGCGVGRNRVIVSKWLELLIFSIIDWTSVVLVLVISSSVFGLKLEGIVIREISIIIVHAVLKNVTLLAFILILVFLFQSVTGPMLLFILASTGIIENLISIFAMNPKVAILHIEKYTPMGLIDYAQTRISMGAFPFFSYLGVAIYIAVGLFVTMVLFKKKELEF